MKIKKLTSMIEGQMATFEADGKKITRRVYYRADCGLYVLIKGYMVFAYDFYTNDEFDADFINNTRGAYIRR